MNLILSLETSTSVCSVALHKNDKLLALAEIHEEQSHGSKLAVLIDEVKEIAGFEFNQLNAVAVSCGPGSYTGLRIGTSTAKGLCYGLGIPLIGVNSLNTMAYQVNRFNTSGALLCPMIDARRMEVFCLLADEELAILRDSEAKIIDENSFIDYLERREILFFGNGAEKCETIIHHPNAKFIKNIYPSAANVGYLALEKYQKKEFEDLVLFEPFYLKEFMIKKSSQIKST